MRGQCLAEDCCKSPLRNLIGKARLLRARNYLRKHLDKSQPDDRAYLQEYMRRLQERAKERGIEMDFGKNIANEEGNK